MTDTSETQLRVDSCLSTGPPSSFSRPNLSKESNKVSILSFVTNDSYRPIRGYFVRGTGPYLLQFQGLFNRVLASLGLLTSYVSLSSLTVSFLI